MNSSARISRLLRAVERGETDTLVRFFARAGWGAAAREVHAEVGRSRLIELSWADEPQALVVLTDDGSDNNVSNWGYSREAPYAVSWRPEGLALLDTHYWRKTPGDTPLIEAEASEQWAVGELLSFLRPEPLLEDAPGAYGAPAKRQRELHETLARALLNLRLQVAQVGLLQDIDPSERDAEVLRLFHQMLFIRFQEDRDHAVSDVRLRDLPESGGDMREALANALSDYRAHLNSELFSPVRIDVAELPPDSLAEVIRQLVEPWKRLRLNFSLSRSEIAGRLYQSYLSSLPAKKPAGSQGTFFGEAHVVDEQAAHASYYTPPGLARLVVERTLVPWLQAYKPETPSDIRILDPACGSGAFLIAGYRALLNYFSDRKGTALTAAERTEVLLQSVVGADIDERALELARVQLLEEADVRGRLPVLGENLLLGDSLPAPPGEDASSGMVDWKLAAGERGFDAVLTNPPFLTRYKLKSKLSKDELDRLAGLYPQVGGAHADYSYFFVELALRLLAPKGVAGFVLPAALVRLDSASHVRARLAEQGLRSVVDFDGGRLFDAGTYVCTVSTGPARSTELLRATDVSRDGRVLLEAAERDAPKLMRSQRVPRRLIVEEAASGWDAFRLQWELELRKEVEADLAPLPAHGMTVRYGNKPGRQASFTIQSEEYRAVGRRKFAVGDHRIPEQYLPRLVKGKQLAPFYYRDTGERLFVPYETNGKLSAHPDVVGELERRGGLPQHPQHGDLAVLRSPKLLLRTLAPEIAAVADPKGDLMPLMGEAGAIAVRLESTDSNVLLAYEALFNSAFYQWWLGSMAQPRQAGWLALNISLVESVPLPSFSASGLDRLSELAAAMRESLALESPLRRLTEYRETYNLLDGAVFDLLGVSQKLRLRVQEEVRRIV